MVAWWLWPSESKICVGVEKDVPTAAFEFRFTVAEKFLVAAADSGKPTGSVIGLRSVVTTPFTAAFPSCDEEILTDGNAKPVIALGFHASVNVFAPSVRPGNAMVRVSGLPSRLPDESKNNVSVLFIGGLVAAPAGRETVKSQALMPGLGEFL
jgi:hypothetical protein